MAPPDHGGGNVVEEGAADKDHGQQHEASLPVIGQVFGQDLRQLRLFEVFGQNGKTEQQTDEVEQHPPLALLADTAQQMVQHGEISEEQVLAEQDQGEAAQRDPHGVVVEQGNPEQGQCKQDELEANPP